MEQGLDYRALFDLAPDGVIACDGAGTILAVNVAVERMFGYARAELIGRPVETLIPVRYRARHGEHIAGFAAHPTPRAMGTGLDLAGLRKDGTEFPVEVSLSPMSREGGLSIAVAVRDITDRRATERDLQRLAAIVDSSEDAIVGETLEGRVISWNASAERIFGYPAGEMIGRSIAAIVPDGRMDEELAMLRAIARGDKVAAFETRRRRRDGIYIDVSIRLSPIIERGTVIGASKVVRDITDRKEMELATRRANAFLASAVEAILDPFALYDERDHVLLVNSAFRHTFVADGTGPIIGSTFDQVLDGCIRAGILVSDTHEDLRGKLAAYHRAPSGTIELSTTHGGIFRLYEQRTAEGGTVALYVDLTTEAQRESELRAAREQADAASASKSEFLSSMSHELRTPLNAILGFTELIQRDRKEPVSERQLERLGHVQRGGEHLMRLINDVLDLARVEAGKLTMSCEPVAIAALVDEVIAQLEPAAARRRISLRQEPPTLAGPVVRADRTRLSQVLMNFGSNAIKYGRDGGHAAFRITHSSHGCVRIAMVDDGAGIAVEHHAKIFEPFQRAGQEAGPLEGTGIGLAISKRLAELMGGTIGFASEIGSGSEFWIELEEVIEDAAAVDRRAHAGARGSVLAGEGTSYLVVYVEDNPSNVALMEAIVEDLPRIEMVTAATAEAGIELIRARHPHVVLMDINLPGMSGIEAKRRLGELPETRAIPVVALSAAALPRDAARADAVGFTRYLTKPIKVDELTHVLEELLGVVD